MGQQIANKDIETHSPHRKEVPASQKHLIPSIKIVVLSLLVVGCIIWGSVMTALYVKETTKTADTTAIATAQDSNTMKSPWYEDTAVTLMPKFKVNDGMMDKFTEVLPKFMEIVRAKEEDLCVHYAFFGPSGDGIFMAQESFRSTEAIMEHLGNVGEVLDEALKYSEIVELVVQGPAEELEKLKEPFADFAPTYYALVKGGMRSKKDM